MSAPSPDPAADVIRHEERLSVTTRQYAAERIRLERIVVTEQRTITVDVRREEIRLTREPLPDDSPPPRGRGLDPIVMVLHEERITIAKTVVPVELITLTTHTVTDDQEITAALRREEIDLHASTTMPQPSPPQPSPARPVTDAPRRGRPPP